MATTTAKPRHSIRMATHRTGLSPHVIRIWEKRYGAVQPNRSGTNRRLYSEAEIERLNLLRLVTHLGHSIGTVAHLPTETLRGLAARVPASLRVNGEEPRSLSAAAHAEEYIRDCLTHIRALNTSALDETLGRSALAFGVHGMLQHVAGPLAQRIGDAWREGTISAAQEHLASARIRTFLFDAARPFAVGESAPTVVVTTPTGQLHELGAAIVAAAATNVGWRVTYLGAGLPAAEIAGVAVKDRAQVVALSIVYPDDDPDMPVELEKLRRHLPLDTRIVAGGRAAPAYRAALDAVSAITITELNEFSLLLDSLRGNGERR